MRPSRMSSTSRSGARSSACSRTRTACGAAARPKTCTRRVSRPGACAPTCARSVTSSSSRGRPTCAPSCAGSDPSWARSATSRSCSTGCAPIEPGCRPPSRKAPNASSAGSSPTGIAPATRIVDALARLRYETLRTRLVAAAEHPRCTTWANLRAVDMLPPIVRRRDHKLRRAVEALGEHPADEALHAVRIRAKRARYAAEATIPVFGKDARRYGKAMAKIQDVLGEHQDAVVARAWLTKTAGECPPDEAFAAGMLAADRSACGRCRPAPSSRPSGSRPHASHACWRLALIEAAGGVVVRGECATARRSARGAPTEVRRLEPAEGQARTRRVPRRRGAAARSRKRQPGSARSAPSSPRSSTGTGTSRPKRVRYWMMTPRRQGPFEPERRGRRGPLDFASRSRDTALLRCRPAAAR